MSQPSDFGKVAVLMGGMSAEREISLLSGAAVLAGLQRAGINAHGIDFQGADSLHDLHLGQFDRVFVILHGRGGEDGQIQGALDSLGLPYTGSNVMASAIGMDKYRTKLIWQALGLPTPAYQMVRNAEDLACAAELGFPLIVKPAHEGSSIGMSKVEDVAQLAAACELAAKFDADVLVERWITGKEYTAAILGEQVLPIIRLETQNQFYDYEAKYLSDDTRYLIPSGLTAAQAATAAKLMLDAFDALGCSGWGRVDFMVDADDQIWLLEVNTVPGMTSHSLVPMAAKAAGISFDELVVRILAESLQASVGASQ